MKIPRRILAALALSALALPAAAGDAGDAGLSRDHDIDEAIRRGVAFLVEAQNPGGSWGSARKTKGLNIYAPVPGAHDAFRGAVTAMGIAALIESGRCPQDPEAAEALARAENWLLEELPKVRRATADAIYNVWTHGYAIQALALMHQRASAAGDQARAGRIESLARQQVELLQRYESVDGGWGYYDFRAGTKRPSSSSISFTSATMLVAFHDAETRIPGFEVPRDLAERALDSIQRQRKPDHSYLYGEYLWARPMHGVNRPAGSLGRSQACNAALRLWGDDTVTDEVLAQWLTRLEQRSGWLDIGRKRPIPHEAWFAVAGYFFYYGHYYAARCIEILPEELARPHRESLAAALLALQESDGSWWDFPFYSYHQPYGTAFALMSLARCRQEEG